MECLDQVNFNLVPADRASTAALDIARRCPACDNYRSGGSPNNTDNNSNCPASRNLISTQSTRFSHCSCPPTTTTTNPNNRTSHNIDCHCNMSPSSPSSSPSLIRPISTSSPKSPTPSSSSPRSTTSSTPTTSHLDHQRICLSCNQSQNQAFNTHSHPFRIPHSSSTTDSLHSLEGSSPPIMTSVASHNTDAAHHSQSSSYDQREFQLNAQVHSPTSTLSAFHRDVNANSDNATTILLPSSSSQSPPYHNHNHQQRNQSKPIPIQNKSPTSRGARPRHHNDTDLTEGCSLTPSAYADRRWGSMNADCQSSRYNPFASSPAERLSLHFYSQQSPKYFRQPSSSSTPTQPDCHSHGQGQGHTTQEPTTPTVFDQWPIGLSTNVKNNNKKTARSPEDNETKRLTKSLPRKTGNLLGQKEADRHRRPHSSWKSRWNSSGGNGDVSSDEDDVMMTPVDGAADPAVANVKPSERVLPQELLFQLHDLEHQNEDLSADVIFSLERKGFVIHEVLGKGISSTVRRVTEKNTGQEYAVKIIDISGEKGDSDVVEQTRKDTLREIQILRMCGSHDNIIHLHDVFETPTFIFLVFELCRQGELFDYLTSVVSLSEKRTRTIMRQLLEAVQYIHEYRVVHRDLKPENILLDDDLNIKVSDFGFATIVDKDEELGELCGTPGYLAPEVLAHSMYENVSGYGKEVDMWACGVIMYTLLCGAPPFWNRRQMMMLRAIMNADYTFNSPEWDDISEAPKKLIKKLLVVNPKERLTAREALAHPFFQSKLQQKPTFKARRKFRAAVFCVLFYKRLSRFYKHPPPISMDTLCTNPYSIKLIRKAIDTCAFSMYRHWVKRVDNQNRAALFEHALRDEWKHNTVVVANNTKETPQTQRH